MTTPVTVTFSEQISERLRILANQRDQDIIALVEAILAENLPEPVNEQDWIDLSEPDEAVEQEMQAYLALHPLLKQQYLGKFVAIYGGQLIDFADDFDTLFDRIDHAYPKQFVWISEVTEEPIETFVVRSPRYVQDEER